MARGALAVWQTAPASKDPEANLPRLADAAATAREQGATILVTPELAVTGYDIGELTDDLVDPALLDRLGEVARSRDIALVVGVALRLDGAIFNCSAIIDRAGSVRAVYRKAHLYGDLDRTRFAAGESCFGMADLDGVRVATLICYDIEFPESVRTAAVAGAQVLAVPTANMKPWSLVNDHIIPARAYENQVVVGYANHWGRERDTEYLGASIIAAPDGTLVRAGTEGDAVLVLPFDTDDIDRGRGAATHLVDRRPELYSSLAEGDRA